jgi:hypothetical protein
VDYPLFFASAVFVSVFGAAGEVFFFSFASIADDSGKNNAMNAILKRR